MFVYRCDVKMLQNVGPSKMSVIMLVIIMPKLLNMFFSRDLRTEIRAQLETGPGFGISKREGTNVRVVKNPSGRC